MVLKRVGVLSVGKVMGAVYALLGAVAGAFFTLAALIGAAAGGGEGAGAMLVGVGAIVVFPILYGAGGFVGGLLMGLFYNLVARMLGGLEVELTP